MTQGYAVGEARALWWAYPTTGNQAGGFTGTQRSLSNGTTSGAYVMSNVKSTAFNFAPPTDVQIQGGDRIVAAPMFGNPRMVPFDVITSDIDDALITLVQLSVTNTTNSFITKWGWNPNKATPAPIGLAIQQRYELATGLSYFLTRIIPKAVATMHPGQVAYRAESDTTVHVSPITGTTSYTGQTYGTGSNNLQFQFEQDRADYYDIITSDPIYLVCFKGDGIATTINLPYRPLSTTVTLNASPNELVIFDTTGAATPTALSAITTGANPTATLAAAGTAGNLNILTYTSNYIP